MIAVRQDLETIATYQDDPADVFGPLGARTMDPNRDIEALGVGPVRPDPLSDRLSFPAELERMLPAAFVVAGAALGYAAFKLLGKRS